MASHPVGISHIPSHFVERKTGQALAGWALAGWALAGWALAGWAHILPYQDIS